MESAHVAKISGYDSLAAGLTPPVRVKFGYFDDIIYLVSISKMDIRVRISVLCLDLAEHRFSIRHKTSRSLFDYRRSSGDCNNAFLLGERIFVELVL